MTKKKVTHVISSALADAHKPLRSDVRAASLATEQGINTIFGSDIDALVEELGDVDHSDQEAVVSRLDAIVAAKR